MDKQKLEVWLDVDFLAAPQKVGHLFNVGGQIRFTYADAWLREQSVFAIDPELTLDSAQFFPKAENFGIFQDASPDRWGKTLLKRREVLQAKDEQRTPKNLYAWDYLIGVQDTTRQGALRFKSEDGNRFLADDDLPVPPVTSLREMEAVARELSSRRIDDLDSLRKWLSVLVSPGASLGGARPKANFQELDGSLWIAKFPAADDMVDVGAWEWVVYALAQSAGIDVPEAKLTRLGKDHHTFCVKRFDRVGAKRVFYASAMTLLQREQSEGTSYLDIAHFLHTHGSAKCVTQGLEQLFRRVIFNVAVGNRDDHLRNHGFLLRRDGWELAPAFDVNANPDKNDHVLNIDEADNRPDIDMAFGTYEWYGLRRMRAQQITQEVLQAVSCWQDVALQVGISRMEIESMRGVFASLR